MFFYLFCVTHKPSSFKKSFRVDADGDGDIDETELKNWIKKQIMDYVQKDAQNVRLKLLQFVT